MRRGAFSLRLRPAREVFAVGESMWIFPLVGHRLHSPRSRRVHACAPAAPVKAGRMAASIEVALTGRAIRRATLRVSARLVLLCFDPPRDSSRGLYWLPCGSHFGPVFSAPALSETRTEGGYRDACSIARSLRGLLDACSILRRGHPPGCASSGAAGRPRAASQATRTPCVARRPASKQARRSYRARKRAGRPKGQRRSRRFARLTGSQSL